MSAVGACPARWRQPVYRGRGPSSQYVRRGNLPAIRLSAPQGLGRLDICQSVVRTEVVVVVAPPLKRSLQTIEAATNVTMSARGEGAV